MTTTTDRTRSTRPKRRHAALGARWFTAGLAVSGTLGIAGYLEVQQLAADSTAGTLTLSQAVPSNTAAPTTTPTPPAAPKVRIVVIPRNSPTSGTTRSRTVPTPTPTPTPAPTRKAAQPPTTQKPTTQATTRGSGG
jgi:hypothetical protein